MEHRAPKTGNVSEVAIFPIPGIVAFPFQKLELHVFEDRYRKLVEDGVRQGREIAIGLAQTDFENANIDTTQYVEVYASGNTLFRPHRTLSAGPFVLRERMPDGRYLIEVDVQRRVIIQNIIQDLPYSIAEVVDQMDEEEDESLSQQLFANLSELCQQLLGNNYESFVKQLPLHVFFNHDLSRYTFEVFKWCRLEPERMQYALEMTKASERAELLIAVITRYLELTGQPIPELHNKEKNEGGDGDLLRVNFQEKNSKEYTRER